MDRRSFIIKGAIGVGAITTSYLYSCNNSSRSIDKVGIQIYTLRSELERDFRGSMEKLSQIGYDYLELYNYENGKVFGNTPTEIKKILDDLGLKAVSSHVGLSNLIDGWENTLEDAVIIGQEFIVCPFLDESVRGSLDDYKRHAALFNRSAETAAQYGLQFGYHNHDFEFKELDGQIPYDVLLKETDPDLVDFQLDLYWIKKGGFDPLDYFNQFPGRFSTWHVKDMADSPDQLTTEVGSGITDWVEIFKKASQSGMKYFFIEQEEFSMPVFSSVEKSYQFIKKLQY